MRRFKKRRGTCVDGAAVKKPRVLNSLRVWSEAISLEPQGNDFTSSGQLGFLLIRTMSGCGTFEHGGEGEGCMREGGRRKEKEEELKEEPGSEPRRPDLDGIKQGTTADHSDL